MPVADTPSSVRILIIDDHALFREGLSQVINSQPGFEVTGKASSVHEALDLITSRHFDIVLLDVDLGTERGIEFLREAARRGFPGKVLVVTAGLSDQEMVQYIQSGAAGVLHKHHPPEVLWQVLHKVSEGEVYLEPAYWKALFEQVHSPDESASPRKRLTEREVAVLKRLVRGLANKEIGSELNVSEASVKSTLQSLFEKTGVRSRSQLVKVALEQYQELL